MRICSPSHSLGFFWNGIVCFLALFPSHLSFPPPQSFILSFSLHPFSLIFFLYFLPFSVSSSFMFFSGLQQGGVVGFFSLFFFVSFLFCASHLFITFQTHVTGPCVYLGGADVEGWLPHPSTNHHCWLPGTHHTFLFVSFSLSLFVFCFYSDV